MSLQDIAEEINGVDVRAEVSAEQAVEFGNVLSLPPCIPGMSKEQSLSFHAHLNEMQDSGASEGKKPAKEKPAKAVPVEPATPLAKAEKLGDKILKYSSLARKYHIGLAGVSMENDMSK